MELRPYQQQDVDKVVPLPAAGLFNEPRTGKTPTSLTAIGMRTSHDDRFVIIAPASILYAWADAVNVWLDRDAYVVEGTAKQRLNMIEEWETGALIINYEALRDRTKYIDGVKHIVPGLYQYILKKHPQAVIVDEAHRIKGRSTLTARAVNRFKKVPFKLCLTGTPAPNKLHEVWAILHFLYPQTYTSYWAWVEENFRMTKNWAGGPHSWDVGEPLPGKFQVLQRELDKFCTNRKRKDIMTWLPDIPEPTWIRLPLNSSQEKQLEELTEFFETEDLILQGVLDRIMAYRMICNAPELKGLKGKSPKIDWINQYLSDYKDVPTIFFTRFSTFARLVEKKTKGKVKVFDGHVDLSTRQDLINDFQSGKINSLVLQIDAGKEGLTLDRAEKIIFLDQAPPASDIIQARDRFVPTVESKADIPKEIIYLMMADTYDEELYHLVEGNIQMTDLVNSYLKYIKKE